MDAATESKRLKIFSLLVDDLSSLAQGHVEALVDVYDALLLHLGENDCCLNIFSGCVLCLMKFILKSLELGQLHLRISLQVLLS